MWEVDSGTRTAGYAFSLEEDQTLVLLGSLLAFLGRMVGRIVNTLLGWATIALFGQLADERRQVPCNGNGIEAPALPGHAIPSRA